MSTTLLLSSSSILVPKPITPFGFLCGLQTRRNKALTVLACTWTVLSCLTQCGNTASVEAPANYRCTGTLHPTSRHDSKNIVCPPLCCGWWFHGTSRIWRSHDHKLHLRSPNQALWPGQLYSSQLVVEGGMSCDLRRHIKVREMCLVPCAIMPTILHLRKSATEATSACAQR